MMFDDNECYQLFIAMDNRARALNGANSEVNSLREKLLPFYRDWHATHPHEVHPSAAMMFEPMKMHIVARRALEPKP